MPCEICGGREEISLCRMCARDEIARKTKFKDDLIEELVGACKCAEADLFGLVSDYLDIDIETSEEPQAKTTRELQTVLAKHKDLKNQGLL